LGTKSNENSEAGGDNPKAKKKKGRSGTNKKNASRKSRGFVEEKKVKPVIKNDHILKPDSREKAGIEGVRRERAESRMRIQPLQERDGLFRRHGGVFKEKSVNRDLEKIYGRGRIRVHWENRRDKRNDAAKGKNTEEKTGKFGHQLGGELTSSVRAGDARSKNKGEPRDSLKKECFQERPSKRKREGKKGLQELKSMKNRPCLLFGRDAACGSPHKVVGREKG